jgi:hypothetical protein
MLTELEDLRLQLESLKESIELAGMKDHQLEPQILVTAYWCRTKLARLEAELRRVTAA